MKSIKQESPNNLLVVFFSFLGAAFGTAIAQRLFSKIDQRLNQKKSLSRPVTDQDGSPSSSNSNTHDDSSDLINFELFARRRTPEIYLGVATVIQGITIGVLGQEIIENELIASGNWISWTMVVSSFIVSVIYWISFVQGYLYLYYIIHLTSWNHLVVTFAYFGMGLCQILAYNLVDEPSMWLRLISVMALVAAIYSFLLIPLVKRHSADYGPLGDQVSRMHRKLAWLFVITTLILFTFSFCVEKFPIVLGLLLLMLLILLFDQARGFRERQLLAHKSFYDEGKD